MLQDVVHPPEQPSMEQVSSPLSAQILELCESELFQEAIQNSEVASTSNCCYEEYSYTTNHSLPPMTAITTTTHGTTTNTNFSTIFEEKIIENDISTAPLDFTTLPQYPFGHQDHEFYLSLLQNPTIPLATDHNIYAPIYQNDQADDRLSSMPPSKCMRLNNPLMSPNRYFIDHSINSYPPVGNSNPILPGESCGIFNGNLLLGNEFQAHELDFHGDNCGIFGPDPLSRPYNSNSNDLQTLNNESQHLVNNGGGSCMTPLAPEMTSLESESFRVANKLTSEERKEKIHRYMKKRNERNFSKKIKYACRKTLADSRPRVRGRFAKNDEFGENNRNTCNTHEEDTDEDVVVKEEEKLDPADIFAHISGLNTFKCNYPIQSWI